MKTLVTGGAGFIGSAVVRLAMSRGYDVVNVDALTYAGSLTNIASVSGRPGYAFEHVDICNRGALLEVFSRHQPDAVIHLAAETHVDRSIDGPARFMETNITGTFNLLECARDLWLAGGRSTAFRFIHVSTDEVYGSLPADPILRFSEASPYDPRSPYSASKAASDHLVRAWGHTYGLPVILTNCSNNYGPFQFPEKLIPVILMQALSGAPIPIYGSGGNVRDWLYVEDHARALLRVLECGTPGATYVIGGDAERTNLEIAHLVCAILDEVRPGPRPYAEQIAFVEDRPGHDARYAINAAKIRAELGWSPSLGLEEGLHATVSWFLENESWWRNLANRSGVGRRLGLEARP